METIEAYLQRKYEELRLLDSCLHEPIASAPPRSIDEGIELKFKLTAALRAQHDLSDWTATETAWSPGKKGRDGPFEFTYDYQRADLEVVGPSFYDVDEAFFGSDIVYTSSGMASISALLLATSHVFDSADVVVLPGSYGETIEFVEGYGRHLRITAVGCSGGETGSPTARILLLNSCTLAKDFEACLRSSWAQFDLCIFDTTCFSSGSGKIKRALRKARTAHLPTVLVRSHTKLDSLGAEYGRLGSSMFVRYHNDEIWAASGLKKLLGEMRNAVRLLGAAALPAHFPPYVGRRDYPTLTARRVAAILRNGRRTAHFFRGALRGLVAQLDFAHGLYVTLKCRRPMDEKSAREAASEMSHDLRRAGYRIRHAGSFGFDFGAAEWVRDIGREGFAVRIAFPDLPTAIWDEQSEAIARWWSEFDRPCAS